MTTDQKEWPPGVAYVEAIGWEEDDEHGKRLVARLVYPTGAPNDLTPLVIWKALPVKIIRVEVLERITENSC